MPPPNRADLIEALTLIRVAVEANAREGREKRREILDKIDRLMERVAAGETRLLERVAAAEGRMVEGQRHLSAANEQVALAVQLREENDRARDESITHQLRQRGDNSGPIALLPPAQVEQPRARTTGEQPAQVPPAAAPATPTLGKDVDEFTSSAGRLWGRLPKAAQMAIVAAISAATAGGFVGGSCEAKHRAEEHEEQQQRHAPPDLGVDLAVLTLPPAPRTYPVPRALPEARHPKPGRSGKQVPPRPPKKPLARDAGAPPELEGDDADAQVDPDQRAEEQRWRSCQPGAHAPDPLRCPRQAEKRREAGW